MLMVQSTPSKKRFIEFDYLPDRSELCEAIQQVEKHVKKIFLSDQDIDLFYEYVNKYASFPAYSVIVTASSANHLNLSSPFRTYVSRLRFCKEDDGSLHTVVMREDHRHGLNAQGIIIHTGARYKVSAHNHILLELLEYA